MSSPRGLRQIVFLGVAFAMSLVILAGGASATPSPDQPNPQVFPPASKPYGKTYAEWGAEWWKWSMAIPYATNPIFDSDGSFCDVDQSGPAWFLAGSAGTTVTRSCTVPRGKAIFFPIIDILVDYPCPPEFGFEPPPGQSLEDFLTEVAVSLIDLVDVLAVEVDGVPLDDLFDYRGTSRLFTFTGDPSLTATFDPCITGSPQVGVSDGYFIMLAPLSAGDHTIHFQGAVTSFGFSLDVTYNLNVGGSSSLATAGAPVSRATGPVSNLKSLVKLPSAPSPARQKTWGELKILYR